MKTKKLPNNKSCLHYIFRKTILSSIAIAYTHSKRGIPTQGGRRARNKLNFVDKAILNNIIAYKQKTST